MADIKINEKLVVSQTGTAEPIMASNVTIPAAGITGVLPVEVTGGSGIDSNKLTHFSTWMMDTGFNNTAGSNTVYTANWTKGTSLSRGYLGSDMTQASGIFTFPVTGIWQITFNIGYNGGPCRYIDAAIETTTDATAGSPTWTQTARQMETLPDVTGGADFGGCTASLIWDVTATTTHKVRFTTYTYSGQVISLYGSATNSYTYATFIRLGDT